ncbi:teicoplanin resistance protein VanZ, partial [Pseudomonas sp. 2822-15]|uniref:VanZ family protein n=1 Tax=Pseudomonas sp. 2822-15 TaxID=1712677 RepID=UPI000C43CD15
IGLFIPFGVYYRSVSLHSSFKKLGLIAIIAICTIETSQFLTKRGSLDIDDLILNVLGVSLGYFLYTILEKVFEKNKVDCD